MVAGRSPPGRTDSHGDRAETRSGIATDICGAALANLITVLIRKSCPGRINSETLGGATPKISANCCLFNPDSTTICFKETIELIKKQAKAEGISPDDLIRELLRDRVEASIEPPVEIEVEPESIDPVSGMTHVETIDLIDRVESQWLKPVKQKIYDAYDRIFASIGDIKWGKNPPEVEYG